MCCRLLFPLSYYQCLMLSRQNGIVPLVAEFLAMFAQVHNTNGFLERNLKHGNSETIPRIYNGLRWTPFFRWTFYHRVTLSLLYVVGRNGYNFVGGVMRMRVRACLMKV
jgi:hypothetical protein